MVTVGLDLHQRSITDCALDDAGTVLAEHRQLEHRLDALGRWLGELAQPAARAGGRWAALYTTDCDMKLAKTLQYVLVLTLAASPAPFVGSVGAQTVRDSAGVRVVLYAASARPAQRWSLDPKPLLEIGGADARGVTEFTEIRGVVRLSDGRVAVANGATNEIRIFDSTGAFQGTAGRAGSGPGEFRRLLRLFRFGEYLAGVDGDTRVQVFSAEGRLVRSLQPVRLEGMRNPQRVGVLTDGGTVLFATKGTQRAAGEETMYAYSVFRGQPDGDSLIPLFEVPG
jgi:hypothetical protein